MGQPSVQRAGISGPTLSATVVDERTHRAEALHRLGQVPDQDVQVVAALGQDHGAGEGLVAPVAAHEAVRHVPVGDIFPVFHGHDLADDAGFQDFMELAPEGCIAQHVADLQHAPGPLGCLHQLDAALQRVGHGFLQQHVVAGLHGGDGRRHVHLVLGGDDGGVAQSGGPSSRSSQVAKAAGVLQIMGVGQPLAADRVRVGHARRSAPRPGGAGRRRHRHTCRDCRRR